MSISANSIQMGPWKLLLLVAVASASFSGAVAANVTFPLPNYCQKRCGDINVTYPFGLQDGCFRPGFKLFCNISTIRPPKLFLADDDTTQVFDIPSPSHLPFIFVSPPSQVFSIGRDDPSTSTPTTREITSWTATAPTFYAASFRNAVTVVGCEVLATLIDGGTNEPVGNCTSTCTDMDKATRLCQPGLGEGCCSIAFQYGRSLKSYKIQLSVLNLTQQSPWTTIVKVLVSDPKIKHYLFDKKDLDGTQNISGDGLRLSLEWKITDQLTCESAQKDKTNYACVSDNSYCYNTSTPVVGYLCYCHDWYGPAANAYVPHGCKDFKSGDRILSKLFLGLIIGVSIGVTLLLFIISTNFIIRKWKKIKQRMIKEKHFHRNHGLLRQQLISSDEDIADRTKIFSLEEMETATNNFDTTHILGRGGHGTVYKGILTDQRVVAIKKSKLVIKGEIDQFINEVVVLSRINHRNIVRLFGCCLETEVPLLVYEFISNGTLYDHLHSRDANTFLSWDDRLRIATEAAAALAYMHRAASISVFHRDVKSSNILLDANLTAKVSDFGTSRLMPDDETHVVTIVQGTYGYLDPQYYQTSQLTEKSDVYSFGVILLELLTGKKPILTDFVEEERSLTINFIRAIDENSQFDLMDARMQVEATKEELEDIARLACMCINYESNARPTMKEVEYKLQVLLRKRKQTQEHNEVVGEPLNLISSNASHGPLIASSSNQGNEDASRNYSMEKYLLSSLDFPR